MWNNNYTKTMNTKNYLNLNETCSRSDDSKIKIGSIWSESRDGPNLSG